MSPACSPLQASGVFAGDCCWLASQSPVQRLATTSSCFSPIAPLGDADSRPRPRLQPERATWLTGRMPLALGQATALGCLTPGAGSPLAPTASWGVDVRSSCTSGACITPFSGTPPPSSAAGPVHVRSEPLIDARPRRPSRLPQPEAWGWPRALPSPPRLARTAGRRHTGGTADGGDGRWRGRHAVGAAHSGGGTGQGSGRDKKTTLEGDVGARGTCGHTERNGPHGDRQTGDVQMPALDGHRTHRHTPSWLGRQAAPTQTGLGSSVLPRRPSTHGYTCHIRGSNTLISFILDTQVHDTRPGVAENG